MTAGKSGDDRHPQYLTYLDSSALVKLVVKEPESVALRRFLRGRRWWVSSVIVRTGVIRAVRPEGWRAMERARAVLRRLGFVQVDAELLDAAALLEPEGMRTRDSIHVASVRALGDDLTVAVTYDRRMAEGLHHAGLPTAAPE